MKFHSERLQKSFDQSKKVLENIHNIKDLISEDIKQLEGYLISLHLNETISYSFSTNSVAGALLLSEELLVWNHNKKRLVYIENRYEAHDWDYYSIDEWLSPSNGLRCENNKITVIEKPLIETAFAIRKKIYEEDGLSKFLSFIAQQYAVAKKFKGEELALNTKDEDDLPF